MAETRSVGLRGRFPVPFLLAGLCLGLLQARAASGQAARIDTIKPAAAYRGDTVAITGNGFGASNVTIEVGGVKAQVLSANGPSIPDVAGETGTVNLNKHGTLQPGLYTLRVHAESESTHAEITSGSDFHTQWGFRLNIEPN